MNDAGGSQAAGGGGPPGADRATAAVFAGDVVLSEQPSKPTVTIIEASRMMKALRILVLT